MMHLNQSKDKSLVVNTELEFVLGLKAIYSQVYIKPAQLTQPASCCLGFYVSLYLARRTLSHAVHTYVAGFLRQSAPSVCIIMQLPARKLDNQSSTHGTIELQMTSAIFSLVTHI